ncbi:unnamed protein product, partial [Polarella glacialis]
EVVGHRAVREAAGLQKEARGEEAGQAAAVQAAEERERTVVVAALDGLVPSPPVVAGHRVVAGLADGLVAAEAVKEVLQERVAMEDHRGALSNLGPLDPLEDLLAQRTLGARATGLCRGRAQPDRRTAASGRAAAAAVLPSQGPGPRLPGGAQLPILSGEVEVVGQAVTPAIARAGPSVLRGRVTPSLRALAAKGADLPAKVAASAAHRRAAEEEALVAAALLAVAMALLVAALALPLRAAALEEVEVVALE